MAYFYLTRLLKERVHQELTQYFSEHPMYSKISIEDKFPLKERPQYGIVFKNSSGSNVHMAADNYKGILKSYVSLYSIPNKPGTSIEMARESFQTILFERTEDVSDQVNGINQTFNLSETPVLDPGPHETSRLDIQAVGTPPSTGIKTQFLLRDVDAENKTVSTLETPPPGTKLDIKYIFKNLDEEGFYYIDFVEKDQFYVDPVLNRREDLITKTTGTETFVDLAYENLLEESEVVMLGLQDIKRDIDYEVDYVTGKLNLLKPLVSGLELKISYLIKAPSRGPFPVEGKIDTEAITGVSMVFGNRVVKGDKMVVQISGERENAAQLFTGRWQMAISMDVYSRDSIQREEITDWLLMFWGFKKEKFDQEGILFEEISYGGESETEYEDLVDEQYFISSVDMNFNVAWEIARPIAARIRSAQFKQKLFPKVTLNSFSVKESIV